MLGQMQKNRKAHLKQLITRANRTMHISRNHASELSRICFSAEIREYERELRQLERLERKGGY